MIQTGCSAIVLYVLFCSVLLVHLHNIPEVQVHRAGQFLIVRKVHPYSLLDILLLVRSFRFVLLLGWLVAWVFLLDSCAVLVGLHEIEWGNSRRHVNWVARNDAVVLWPWMSPPMFVVFVIHTTPFSSLFICAR